MSSPPFSFRFSPCKAKVLIIAAALLSPLFNSSLAYAQAKPRLALVTRDVPAPGADKAYLEHLTKQGWDVTLVDDDKIRASGRSAIKGYDLVVISSTVYPGRIRQRLRSAPEPIIIAKHQLFSAFGLTENGNGSQGLTNPSKTVVIANSVNPMAAGLDGEVYVSTNSRPINYGKVGPDAYVVATAKNAADKAVIFAYERGAKLVNGEVARGPRVGFYMSQPHPRLANRDGWALFDAAAAWAAPTAPEVNSNAPIQQAPTTTEDGVLFGGDVTKENFPTGYDAIHGVEKLLGRRLDIVNRFHEFSAGLTSSFFWDRRHIKDGRTLLISWRATDNPGIRKGKPDPKRATKIVNGRFDKEIRAMATALRDLEAPILLLFNWEMDQSPGAPQHIGDAEEFIAAWRYVHRMFEESGATNVEWVWAPRARSFAKGRGQTFYPGYDYVDWVGGLSVPINTFEDPRTIYSAWNQWAVNVGKPQLLWIGLRENPRNSSWKMNFLDELRSLATGEWPGIKALVYYSAISPLGYDYTIDSSTSSLKALRRLSCDPNFTTVYNC